jgi:hypothetical protein
MRCLRLSIAILIMRGAGIIAEFVAGPDLSRDTPRLPMRPAERMLLGSIVGFAICVMWIWISARAGR